MKKLIFSILGMLLFSSLAIAESVDKKNVVVVNLSSINMELNEIQNDQDQKKSTSKLICEKQKDNIALEGEFEVIKVSGCDRDCLGRCKRNCNDEEGDAYHRCREQCYGFCGCK